MHIEDGVVIVISYRACVLLVHEKGETNIYDSRPIEFLLWKKYVLYIALFVLDCLLKMFIINCLTPCIYIDTESL